MGKRKSRGGRKSSSSKNNKSSSTSYSSSSSPSPSPIPRSFLNSSNNTESRKNNPKKSNSKSTPAEAEAEAEPPAPLAPLILTSVKRTGLYECDFCHTDISQVPRICCAVCVDFDICLECFTNVNHDLKYEYDGSLISSGNGSGSAGSSIAGVGVDNDTTDNGPNTSFSVGGIMSASANVSNGDGGIHTEVIQRKHGGKGWRGVDGSGGGGHIQPQKLAHTSKHGYRVADSTRYFMFPSLRGVDVIQNDFTKDKENKNNKDKDVDKEITSKKADSNVNTDTSKIDSTIGNDNDDDDDDDEQRNAKRAKLEKDNNKNQTPQEEKMEIDGEENTTTNISSSNTDSKSNEKFSAATEAKNHENRKHEKNKSKEDEEQEEKMDVDNDDNDHNDDNKDETAKKIEMSSKEEKEEKMDVDGDGDGDHKDENTKKIETSSTTAMPSIEEDGKEERNENSITATITSSSEPNIGHNGKGKRKNMDPPDAEMEEAIVKMSKGSTLADDVDVDADGNKTENEKDDTVTKDASANTAMHEKNERDESTTIADDGDNSKKENNKDDTVTKDASDVTTTISAAEPKTENNNSSTKAATTENDENAISNDQHLIVTDDVRYMWTVEEDLRLLEAISTCGLGNWADISEEVCGTSSTNKTPKRCMERYLYDYLGRYGHILPEYTMVQVQQNNSNEVSDKGKSEEHGSSRKRSRQRRNDDFYRIQQQQQQQPTSISLRTSNKEYAVMKSSSLPGYDKVWVDPYIPPISNIQFGDDVGRDLAVRSEHNFVKALSSVSNTEEAKSMRKEWEPKLNQPGGPKVLPPRAEDVKKLPGAELAGFMPRRGDFDIEWDNDADKLLEDMEFLPSDTADDREIKVKVIEIYNSRLDEREKRKQFLVDHDLLDYRKKQREDRKLPSDERDLVNRMRLFARFHSAAEHKKLIDDILKAKRLRKEIARLQMYQRMGFNSLLDVERFELDRNRRESHRLACRQREKEEQEEQLVLAKVANDLIASGSSIVDDDKETYNRHYKNSDRKIRRSINRSGATSEKISEGNEDAENATKPESTVNTSEAPNGDDDTNPSPLKGGEKSTPENKDSISKASSTSPAVKKFDVKKCEGYELLSSKEVNLCQRLEIEPKYYLDAKSVLIQESLSKGILDDTTSNNSKRSIVKIDVKAKGDIVKFILNSGWAPSPPAQGKDDTK